jgi:Putative prokaryotic signal transducing protein
MVTLRTYLNPTQALLDKTLLDSSEIFCAIADQNANLYGGGPFAMPVRLLVAEEQAEEADRILKDSDQLWPEEQAATFPTESANEETPKERGSNNPWEILAIASLFFFPGVCLLLQTRPAWIRRARTMLPVSILHVAGWLAIAVGLSFTILYFYTRRSLARDKKAAGSKIS